MKILTALLFVSIGLFSASSQERFVKPLDDGGKDASLVAFRTKLIAATKKRDTKFILSILDPKIVSSFGGDEGVADFKRYWKISTAKSEFWATFLPVITNGGEFMADDRSLFCAPYLFTSFPDDLDSFLYLAIFGNNVNLRSAPSLKAPVIAQLSYNVVEPVEQADRTAKSDWIEIRTLGGKKGFVKSEFVRSPIDYRACFAKKGGKWKMTAFVAGD
ncbi:MAG: SH3 domain-containing protein [Acidobacteria bacterium]|nr:SH3 domain-containing protein [Acidobacteriota bacterium]